MRPHLNLCGALVQYLGFTRVLTHPCRLLIEPIFCCMHWYLLDYQVRLDICFLSFWHDWPGDASKSSLLGLLFLAPSILWTFVVLLYLLANKIAYQLLCFFFVSLYCSWYHSLCYYLFIVVLLVDCVQVLLLWIRVVQFLVYHGIMMLPMPLPPTWQPFLVFSLWPWSVCLQSGYFYCCYPWRCMLRFCFFLLMLQGRLCQCLLRWSCHLHSRRLKCLGRCTVIEKTCLCFFCFHCSCCVLWC